MSISDRLQELISCKSDIKTAIEEKGVSVTGGLSTYAEAIDEIITALDCEVIYVPRGINIGINTYYTYGTQSGNMDSYKHNLPKQIAFDITDNPDFKISNNDSIPTKITTTIIRSTEKTVMVVDFK